MGKSLKQLLETFPFENGLNPRNSGPGAIKPEPNDRFTNDNKQSLDFVKEMPKLYGTDIVRITTATDPHETKRTVKKGADKVGGALAGTGMIGTLIGGAVSKVAEFHPKFPDDWTNDVDAPTKMETNFYAGLVNGDYARGHYYNAYHKNSKSKLGQFLQANKNPEQVKNAILPALKSAIVGLAVAGIGLGIASLFSKKKNKKKGKPGPDKPKKNERGYNSFYTLDKFNKPYFPSTLLINEKMGDVPGIGLSFRNYSRLTQRNGNLGSINYLEKDGVTLLKEVAPTLDNTQFTEIDEKHGISDYYAMAFRNATPQTRNTGNIMVSAQMLQNNYQPAYPLDLIAKDYKGGTYSSDRDAYASGRALDDKVQNYSRFVDAAGNAFVQYGFRNKDGSFSYNDIEKSNTLFQRYGAGFENLLTITLAKEGDTPKINAIGNPTDPNGNFYVWAPTDTSYTKDFISDKNNTIFISGDKYANDSTKTDSTLVTSDGGLTQLFGSSNTNLLQPLDLTDETNYKFPYKTINGKDTVARWNSKSEPFSKSKDTILSHGISFLQLADQTQTNYSEAINPYLTLKQNILENKDDDIVRVTIGGIRFLATVTNLSDKNTSNWDSVKPVGSGINFYLFNSWERSISFDLLLYAENRTQLDLIWQKVDDVASLTTGRPSGNKGAAYGVYGNIVRLEIGDLISENGFVSDITMNVDTNSPWEIDPGQQLPFVCTISVGFQVVTSLEGNEYGFYNK